MKTRGLIYGALMMVCMGAGWASAFTEGGGNNFFGTNAGAGNTGSGNTFVGGSAGTSANSGWYNTFLGYTAGYLNSTGMRNTIIGVGGYSNQTGSGNVFLGYGAGNMETGSNKLYIDNCYPGGQCTDPFIYGEFDNNILNINGTLIMGSAFSLSDIRLKKNIEPLHGSLGKVMGLKGVSYEWKADVNEGRGFSKGKEIGLVAQDVEAVIPELVHTDTKGYKSLSYDKFVPVLVEAIKELQEKNEKLEQRLLTLEAK